MAFRRRSFRRTFRAQRNNNMRVWTAVASGQGLTTGTQVDATIADAAAFATTSGNTKHIGTLVRIRGHISFDNSTSTAANVAWGISLADVSETIQNVDTSAYGRDEDVLGWEAFRQLQGSTVMNGTIYKEIDIKAKRRFDVENILVLSLTGITGVDADFSLRCLFLVP